MKGRKAQTVVEVAVPVAAGTGDSRDVDPPRRGRLGFTIAASPAGVGTLVNLPIGPNLARTEEDEDAVILRAVA